VDRYVLPYRACRRALDKHVETLPEKHDDGKTARTGTQKGYNARFIRGLFPVGELAVK
jgi:hypothetical protein